jgi:hypothetical protein
MGTWAQADLGTRSPLAMDDNQNAIVNSAKRTDSLVNTRPEWLRIPEAIRLFGVGRSKLYELIGDGSIRSTCLRKRGAVRGIRLISFDSLASHVENEATGGGQARRMPQEVNASI